MGLQVYVVDAEISNNVFGSFGSLWNFLFDLDLSFSFPKARVLDSGSTLKYAIISKFPMISITFHKFKGAFS